MKPGFDASGWQEGPAGFGTQGAPGAVVRTTWRTADIWLRREFTLPANAAANPQFHVYHDEDVEIYVNGVPAASESGFTTSYVELERTEDNVSAARPTRGPAFVSRGREWRLL